MFFKVNENKTYIIYCQISLMPRCQNILNVKKTVHLNIHTLSSHETHDTNRADKSQCHSGFTKQNRTLMSHNQCLSQFKVGPTVFLFKNCNSTVLYRLWK